MNASTSTFRPALAGLALAAAACLGGNALAASPITTPTTAPLSVIGGNAVLDLTKAKRDFDPAWWGDEASYTSVFDLTEMTRGGSLLLTEAVARVTFTLVGFEAGFVNTFQAGGQTLRNPNLGSSFSFDNVAAGLFNFGFLSNGTGAVKGNGNNATGVMLAADNRSALIMFNDSFKGDRDYDDMVIRMMVTPVPEPETIGMLLAGLGVLSLVVRRRNRKT